jgi:peptidoglycan/LPS O-acetylase OafA/YrhL
MAATWLPAMPPAVSLRIRHVDSLRAVAAGLVVWAHLVQAFAPISGRDPAFLRPLDAWPEMLNVGRIGVTIFFAVSGFVICRSFGGSRIGGARRFVIRRCCRLYPAFWVSMLAGIPVLWLTGIPLSWAMFWANLTMAPTAFDQRPILGVYWTLEIELIFYGLCLGLYLLRAIDKPLLLAALSVLFAALPRILRLCDHLAATNLRPSPGQTILALNLAVMFWGAVFRIVYDATGGFRRGVFANWGTAGLVILTLALIDIPDPKIKWDLLGRHAGPLQARLSVFYAVVIFVLWVACLRIDNPALTYLGVISYSLYLFHPVVMYPLEYAIGSSFWLGGLGIPLWFYLIVGASLSTWLAGITYRWIEHPAISLGKRWVSGGCLSASPGAP